jgi:hypothetical protein
MPTETDIANLALGKLGGAGSQLTASGFISSINGTDMVSGWCRTLLPVCRERVIVDLAVEKCPLRESIVYKDMGAAIDESGLPEIGDWTYAFNVPTDCLAVIWQIDEDFPDTGRKRKYKFETILNKGKNGLILLTNNLSNSDGDSAFIAYATDIKNPNAFNSTFTQCLTTLLASELCPLVGKETKVRTELLAEYKQVCLPDAKSFNQSQLDNQSVAAPNNYLGGRNSTISLYRT